MLTAQFSVYSERCTVYSVPYPVSPLPLPAIGSAGWRMVSPRGWRLDRSTLYTVHCTLYTVHCTLYTVHSILLCTAMNSGAILYTDSMLQCNTGHRQHAAVPYVDKQHAALQYFSQTACCSMMHSQHNLLQKMCISSMSQYNTVKSQCAALQYVHSQHAAVS